MSSTPDVAARRIGMFAAGIVLLTGAVLLFANALGVAVDELRWPRVSMPALVKGTWTASLVVGATAYALIRHRPVLARPVDPAIALAVPAFGAALWLPITLHYFVFVVGGAETHAFDEWASSALLATIVVHGVFATMVGRRAVQLVRGAEAITVTRIFVTCFAVSMFPWAILLMIPPIVVAVTGLPLLPLLRVMERLAAREREATVLPLARVIA